MTPRVSVLLPVRDARGTLAEALQSLLAQDLGALEVVLVDDGSTDGSADLARAVWPDDRLRVLTPGRVGLVTALNTGLDACRAELVARMDADDVCAPARLRLQVQHLDEHPEVSVVGCLVRCFAARGLEGGYTRYEAWINGLRSHDDMVREIFIESPLAHPSVVYRRAAIVGLGGYRDLGWPEDYDLWLRAARAGLRLDKVPEVLLSWRDEPDRTSRRNPAYSAEAILRCKAHHLAAGPLATARPVVIWGAGPIGARLARALRGRGVTISAFVDIDPRKVGRSRGGASIIPPAALAFLERPFVVAAVGAAGARALIREHLVAGGLVEGADFVCAA